MVVNFKNDLPEKCPDKDIQDVAQDKIFFRITKSYPATEEDFIPTWLIKPRYKDECLERGLSVSEKLGDARNLMRSFKKLGTNILSGTIKYEEHGIIKLTPSNPNPSHRTWYPLDNTNEIEIFSTLEV